MGGATLLLLFSGETVTPITCGTNLLRRGNAWLTTQLKANASEPIVYRRGTDSVSLCAIYGAKLLKLGDESGFRLEWTDMDFLIPAADLVLSGNRITPERGDEIDITTDTGTETFQVFPFGGEPPWRWSDAFGSMIRVHTKRITEPVI